MKRLPEHLPARLLFIALFGGFGALLIDVGVETIQEGHPTQGALFIVGVAWVASRFNFHRREAAFFNGDPQRLGTDLLAAIEDDVAAPGIQIKFQLLDAVNTLDRASQAVGSRRSRHAANMDHGIGYLCTSCSRRLTRDLVGDTPPRDDERNAEPGR